ncbi:MAG TPA: sodium-dependent transporter [Steroidobacteraceae bacterium]|nr:sodium-dependent transporter [Steroidobacteraceae bacterium]
MNGAGPRWSSEVGFLLSAVGAAVGLGSIWRFPYLAGAGGGFAFIAVFVLACLVFGAPVLIAEIVTGRWSRHSPPRAAGAIAARFGYSRGWNVVGWTGSIAGYLILSYYTMIAGWVLAYTWFFLTGTYARGGAPAAVAKFHAFVADSRTVSLWQLAFFALVTFVSARQLNRGVEWANRWRAPALLAILLVLVVYSLATGDVARGLRFAFAPDVSRLTPAVVLEAVGQALFALGVSAGIMIAYGAYMPSGESLRRSVLVVIGSIFIVSLLATVVIFPLMFHYGLDPAEGPELVFQVLPVAFAEMPGGRLIGTLFFALLALAAFTPSVGLMEPWIAWLSERASLGRRTAACICAALCWLIGQGSVLSFGRWASWHPAASIPHLSGLNVFGLLDLITANVLMPISALLVSVFIGWRMGQRVPAEELSGLSAFARRISLIAMRYVCPVGIVVVLIVGFWK